MYNVRYADVAYSYVPYRTWEGWPPFLKKLSPNFRGIRIRLVAMAIWYGSRKEKRTDDFILGFMCGSNLRKPHPSIATPKSYDMATISPETLLETIIIQWNNTPSSILSLKPLYKESVERLGFEYSCPFWTVVVIGKFCLKGFKNWICHRYSSRLTPRCSFSSREKNLTDWMDN